MTSRKTSYRSYDGPRTNDPARTMSDIIAVATREFAEKGLSGARIDEIAALTQTSKRMIYYYYGSKEGLYLAVLEDAYARTRSAESGLHLDDVEPVEALKKLVSFSIDYKLAHPDFVRLVMTENIHSAEYLKQSKTAVHMNTPAIDLLKRIYDRGVASGDFRSGIEAFDLHMAISALSLYNVSNRPSIAVIFNRDIMDKKEVDRMRKNCIEMLLRFVKK
jgi:AcrR family transcriptional regulator